MKQLIFFLAILPMLCTAAYFVLSLSASDDIALHGPEIAAKMLP